MPSPDSPVHRYHDGTKHHFTGFARSLGYLDWASQPRPFRSFVDAPAFPLFPRPDAVAEPYSAEPVGYDRLFLGALDARAMGTAAIGDLLRHALGLSAWKEIGRSRWSLRVNPSSGNLHPTEAYVVCGPRNGWSDRPAVYHYAPEQHALELRAVLDQAAWDRSTATDPDLILIALTSIHWRESWKYGERAFRYCQHDIGHAIGAVAMAAAMLGRRATLLPTWPHRDIETLIGIDRDADFIDAEREEPACLLAITSAAVPGAPTPGVELADAARSGQWFGHASQLSEDHVEWSFIDAVARATEDPGHPLAAPDSVVDRAYGIAHPDERIAARDVVLQRRSAVAFDGVSSLPADAMFRMLDRVMPRPSPPWPALWWTPRIHLLLFVHRVAGLDPGLYFLGREPAGAARLRAAAGRDFQWEPAHERLPFVRLARGDCRAMARRVSCDQDIAADGFFSFGMLAEFDASLAEHGQSFYRHLFLESGVLGQQMYLEAEAAGVRATGIGCFFDDAVHDVLGLADHAFQSLYHFTVGMPIDDPRLTLGPGYGWESVAPTDRLSSTAKS